MTTRRSWPSAAQAGARAEIAVATDALNRRQIERVARIVEAHAAPRQHRIAVLGLSYKPDTPVVEESQGVMLANRLASDGFATMVFDPAAVVDAPMTLAASIVRASSLAECVAEADVLVLMVPWPEFRQLPALLQARLRKPPTVIDCWRLLTAEDLKGLAEPIYLGKSRASDTSRELAGVKSM